MYLLKVLLIQSCRLQAWLGPVGSEHAPGRAVRLCKLFTSEKNDTSQCQFWEDIVCKYWKWAGKAGGLGNCDMKPALSVMHTKAHSWTCQV